jgi:hypothetical protein
MALMKTLISAAAACAAVLLLAGCTAEGQKQNIGKVRTFNAVFESSSLRVDADDDAIVSQLAYASLANYKELNSGSRAFKVFSSGGTKLFETTFTLSEGAKQLFVVAGTLGNYSGFFVDDSTADPGDNKIKVRMIHAAAGVPSLDVYLTSAGEDISAVNPTLSGTAYKGNSSFLEMAAGTYKLRLTTNGTKDVVYESDTVTLNNKDIVSFAAFPSGSGKLVNVHQMKHNDSGDGISLASKIARFKAANAVPGTTLNVLVDGAQSLSGIPFQGLSSYQTLASGTRQVRMEPASTPGTALASTSLAVEPAREYTLLAMGTTGNASLVAIPSYTQTLNTAKVRIRVINAVNGGAAVNLLVNFTASASNISAGSASRYAELDLGTYNISVSSASSGATLFALNGRQFVTEDTGKLYAVVLTGDGTSVQGVFVADS